MRTALRQHPLSGSVLSGTSNRASSSSLWMRSRLGPFYPTRPFHTNPPRLAPSPLQQKHQLLKLSRLQRRRRRQQAHDRTGGTGTITVAEAASEGLPEAPSLAVLRMVAITTGIPFIGFGIMDNALLIVAGDAIDTSLGVLLGISTLCAAAIGNIISDLAGIGLGTVIEDFCANTLKLPVPQLSTAQRQLRSVRFAQQAGMAVGMTFGCIVGMFPLFFIDTNKTAKLRQRAQVETLFRDVVTEAKTLVGAESTCLYLRVDKDDDDDDDVVGHKKDQKTKKAQKKKKSGVAILPYRPSANGEYLYAMYYVVPQSSSSEASNRPAVLLRGHKSGTPDAGPTKSTSGNDPALPSRSRILPVGRGIVSRALLTGDTWNIANVMEEPDFFPALPPSADASMSGDGHPPGPPGPTDEQQHQQPHQPHHQSEPKREDYRNLVVVPILDGQGRAIAVLEALNKRGADSDGDDGDDDGFTDQDVEILKSLASHISVSLQVLYQDAATGEDGDDYNVRLRDTIRILKEMGIQGITDTGGGGGRRASPGPSLFPSTSASPSSIARSKTTQLFPEQEKP